jgi:hypothetical protein
LPLRSGRFLTGEDVAVTKEDQNSVVIVNQAFAEKFFAGENPLGKRLLNG